MLAAASASRWAHGGGNLVVRIFLSTGLLLEMNFFFMQLVNPDQDLGVLFLTINKMIANDILKFMKVFFIVFINYGFAM